MKETNEEKNLLLITTQFGPKLQCFYRKMKSINGKLQRVVLYTFLLIIAIS